MSDLMRGTELDLYDAFDAVVIAAQDSHSPPTFLAARYHVAEEAMRTALDRGAQAAGERLAWNEADDAGRARAEHVPDPGDAGVAADAGTASGDPVFTLATRGLVVVAPRASVFDGPSLADRMDAGGAALGSGNVALVSDEASTRPVSVGQLQVVWRALSGSDP